jgi:hypothetical protein
MYCPNRWDLLGQLAELDQWAVNNTRTSLATVRQLNRTVGFSLGISWHIGYNADLQLGDNTVGAVYDAVSYELELPTYIDAFVYIGGNQSTWTADSWLHFKRKVADTICHEQIHVKQTIEVDDIDYTYLSNPRELDAYAFNVAAEMYDYWTTDVDCALENWTASASISPPNMPSMSLWAYADEFGLKDPIMIDLVNRAKEYLVEIKKQLDNQ